MLARAGSSVWEIAAAGKPAILVPYPFATADHQAKNADYFVQAGGAIMIRELDLDDVPDRVRSLLDDAPRLEQMGEAMLRAARPNAAEEIAEGLIALAAPLTGGSSGSSGSAARGFRRTRSSRAPGGPRSGLGPRGTPYLEALARRANRDFARAVVPDGWEVVVSSAYPACRAVSRGVPRASSPDCAAPSSSAGRTARERPPR